jgi:hypothetical protein
LKTLRPSKQVSEAEQAAAAAEFFTQQLQVLRKVSQDEAADAPAPLHPRAYVPHPRAYADADNAADTAAPHPLAHADEAHASHPLPHASHPHTRAQYDALPHTLPLSQEALRQEALRQEALRQEALHQGALSEEDARRVSARVGSGSTSEAGAALEKIGGKTQEAAAEAAEARTDSAGAEHALSDEPHTRADAEAARKGSNMHLDEPPTAFAGSDVC